MLDIKGAEMKKNIGRKRKSKKGVALIIAVMFSMIMIIIVGVILKLAQGHYHSSAYQIKHTKAFYLANAGAEWAIYRCRTAPGTFSGDINAAHVIEDPPGSGYYPPIDVTIVSRGGGEYNISSTVDTNKVRLR